MYYKSDVAEGVRVARARCRPPFRRPLEQCECSLWVIINGLENIRQRAPTTDAFDCASGVGGDG